MWQIRVGHKKSPAEAVRRRQCAALNCGLSSGGAAR
jgi:hypothetical protein